MTEETEKTEKNTDNTITKSDLNSYHIRFIENQNNCAICSSQLNLNIEYYYNEGLVREEAHCPHCNVKTRVKNYPLL